MGRPAEMEEDDVKQLRSRTRMLAGLAVLALAAAATSGCLLLNWGSDFQSLVLHFRLAAGIPAGLETEIHTGFYPHEVGLKKQFVQISGHIDVPSGGEMPTSVMARNAFQSLSGSTYMRLNVKVPVKANGNFSVRKRVKKDIKQETLHIVTIEPLGGDLAQGSEITLCVDVSKNKGDLSKAGDCQGESTPPPGSTTVIVEVRDNLYEPKQVKIDSGDTVRWVMRGSNANHTVTEMNGAFDSGFVFQADGNTFDRKFTQNNQTFNYSCVSHAGCCDMRGSVQVGENAPAPEPGY